MKLEKLKKKLSKYDRKDIIVTDHAKLRASFRKIDLEEVKSNILDPKKLVYAKEQESEKEDESKYECYFAYSKIHCHKYVLTINQKIIIVTVININRDWQKIIERK